MRIILTAVSIVLLTAAGCSHVRGMDSAQSIAVLKEDPDKAYAESVFYFCAKDASAVPFLLEKLSDADAPVRRNAVHLLGKWLITPQAIEPFKALYFKEPDFLIRKSILDALQILIASPDRAKAFISEVVQKEQNSKLNGYAQVMLEGFDQKRETFLEGLQTITPDAVKFKKEYDPIYLSASQGATIQGRDLDRLLRFSSPADENALKALRIKLLKGKSQEALFNYQKINSTILLHRYANSIRRNNSHHVSDRPIFQAGLPFRGFAANASAENGPVHLPIDRCPSERSSTFRHLAA